MRRCCATAPKTRQGGDDAQTGEELDGTGGRGPRVSGSWSRDLCQLVLLTRLGRVGLSCLPSEMVWIATAAYLDGKANWGCFPETRRTGGKVNQDGYRRGVQAATVMS